MSPAAPNPRPRRKRAFHPGHWQLQRERLHLEATRPPPPDRPAKPLADGVAALLRTFQPAADAWIEELGRSWATLVGATLALHTRPGSLEKQTLTVYVDSSPWLSELQRFGQGRMLANIQTRFGADRVRALRLRLDPAGGRPRPAT